MLLDLAGGRGGYRMWLARETGGHVVGVDLSHVRWRTPTGAWPTAWRRAPRYTPL